MKVKVNGELREIPELPEAAPTVRTILDALRYSFPLLIVRVNGRLVDREAYAKMPVSEGDDVVVYHLVAGG
jgi:sulfur carrier protein